MASSGKKSGSVKAARTIRKGAGSRPSPTMRRQQKERRERLKLIREQVADGTLTIRQMTPKERRENPPRNAEKRS
jgi:hypothetical protein